MLSPRRCCCPVVLLLLLLLCASFTLSSCSALLDSEQQPPTLSVPEQPSDLFTSTLRVAVAAAAMVSAAALLAFSLSPRLTRHCLPLRPSVDAVLACPALPLLRSASSLCSCVLRSSVAQSASSAVAPSLGAASFPSSSGFPSRLPSLFISHGGGPSFFMDATPGSRFADIGPDSSACQSLQSLAERLELTGSRRPRALLVISGHWETSDGSVHITARSSYPSLFYDYYGFPAHTYKLQYPAPGDEQLSRRVHSLLSQAGIAAQLDTERLFDHGVFVPLLLVFPAADIPIVQLSLLSSLDAGVHLSIGRALSSLRDEGVLIIGSGSITHNFAPTVSPRPFMARMTELLTQAPPQKREEALRHWQLIEGATDAHKRAEHLLPLMVAVGAAGDEQGTELAKLFVLDGSWAFANYKASTAQTQIYSNTALPTQTRAPRRVLTSDWFVCFTRDTVRQVTRVAQTGSDEAAIREHKESHTTEHSAPPGNSSSASGDSSQSSAATSTHPGVPYTAPLSTVVAVHAYKSKAGWMGCG